MKVSRTSLILMISIVTLFGCGREEVAKPRPAIQVRLLDSETGDEIWRKQADSVLEHLRQEFGAVATRVLVHGSDSRRAALRSCGEEEVDLVLCVGRSFENEVLTVAQNYPQTAFLLSPGMVTSANVAVLDFQPFGAAYIGGVIAAAEGGKRIGLVAGDGGPWLEVIVAGFTDGFRSRFPSGRVHSGIGPEGVARLADESVTVALYASDRPNQSILEAAQAAEIKFIGVGRRTVFEHPEVVVAALFVDLPEAIDRIMRDVLDGTFEGRIYTFDLGSGVVDLAVSPELQASWTDDELLRIDEARAAVNAGLVELENMGL